MKRKGRASRPHQRFILRDAGARDVDLLVRHRREMWEDLGVRKKLVLDEADRVYGKWVKSGFKNGSLLGWIAETKEGVVVGSGCIWLRPVTTQTESEGANSALSPVDVHRTTLSQKRRGVHGSEGGNQVVSKNGYSRLALHASQYGRGLYRKHGFTRSWEMRLKLRRTGATLTC